jgi:hypothetical protein
VEPPAPHRLDPLVVRNLLAPVHAAPAEDCRVERVVQTVGVQRALGLLVESADGLPDDFFHTHAGVAEFEFDGALRQAEVDFEGLGLGGG